MTFPNDLSNEHVRAIGLLAEAADGLSPADTAWLQRHLAGCADCSRYAELQQSVSSALRSVSVLASPSLIAATQARLRVRAAELRESHSRRMLLAISISLGIATSIIWGFALWNVAQWVELHFELASFALSSGMLLLWALMLSPLSLLVAYFLLVRRAAKTSPARAVN